MDFDYQSSLSRRLRAVHSLYYEACASMDLEQVNRVVVPGVLPIAFSLVHQLLIEDGSVVFVGDPVPQMSETWATHGLGDQRPRQGQERHRDDGSAHRRLRGVPRLPATGVGATEHFVGLSGMTF